MGVRRGNTGKAGVPENVCFFQTHAHSRPFFQPAMLFGLAAPPRHFSPSRQLAVLFELAAAAEAAIAAHMAASCAAISEIVPLNAAELMAV